MNKEKIIILFVLLIIPINVFAFEWPDFSIGTGGGGLIGYTFTRYTLKAGDAKSTQDMDRFNLGAFVFADFTYAELSLSYKFMRNSYREKMVIEGGDPVLTTGTGQEMSLGISLLAKYPFKINNKFTWFPLLGFEYEIALQQLRKPNDGLYEGYVVDRTDGRLMEDWDKDGNPYPLSAWNSWNIILGAGTDYYLTQNLFLRGEFLFGFRLPTGYELGALDMIKGTLGSAKLGGINGSPTIKIAIGYRFNIPSRKQRAKSSEQQTVSSEEVTTEYVEEIEEEELVEEVIEFEEEETETTEQEVEIEETEDIEEIEEASNYTN